MQRFLTPKTSINSIFFSIYLRFLIKLIGVVSISHPLHKTSTNLE
ncbi:hypothetical protein C4K04_5100 [Pseudomonas chlororaphis]|uniref:Uncharacterized protein n=1 Tax=Pseudomonas chlororaphis TaxID=587753 RepID=A0A3G7TUP6_9PSED|nr:hypothetical protein C4K04_5100 [Pseudomonas chlororaphis]